MINVRQIIVDVEKELRSHLSQNHIPFNEAVFVNPFSGGKDSTASRLIMGAILGDRIRSIMSDTDNEHPVTIDFARNIHNQDGLPPVEIYKQIYDEAVFNERRESLIKRWSKHQRIQSGAFKGVKMPMLNDPNSHFAELWRKYTNLLWAKHDFATPLEACLHHLQRTDNEFLNGILIHGSMPTRKARWCTDELKLDLIWTKVNEPLINDGEYIISCSGVRAQESEKRAGYKVFEKDYRDETESTYNFLPIHKLTHAEVFAVHKYFGVKPNPLYKEGMARVGCMPCIMCNKEELAEIAARYPAELSRINEWERKLRWVSRWSNWMVVPQVNQKLIINDNVNIVIQRNEMRNEMREVLGKKLLPVKYAKSGANSIFGQNVLGTQNTPISVTQIPFLGVRGNRSDVNQGVYDAIEWAKTGRAGKIYNNAFAALGTDTCSSRYGLCE